jgi:hypothetical protein
MSDTDQNTATEKQGRRNRKSGSRNQKPELQPDAQATINTAAASADTAAPAGTTSPAADSAAPATPETIVPTGPAPVSFQTIANAYGDYTRKSLEETRSFVEKLGSVRSLDKAMEVHSDFAARTYDTLVAESQRIRGLHRELAKQTLKPLEDMLSKASHAGR